MYGLHVDPIVEPFYRHTCTIWPTLHFSGPGKGIHRPGRTIFRFGKCPAHDFTVKLREKGTRSMDKRILPEVWKRIKKKSKEDAIPV
jgi:hypothetical protein